MKLSDYVIDFLSGIGIRNIFLLSGGGNLHLIDSVSRHPKIKYITAQHEEAIAFAAEGYAKATGNIGTAIVTSGPGGTNAVTGVADAWLDSIPVIFISGQVNTNETIRKTGIRQFGPQEINIIDIVKPITKYTAHIDDENLIRYHLEKALYHAISGRPGPVWLDIPLNIQHAVINPGRLKGFIAPRPKKGIANSLQKAAYRTIALIKKSERPVLLIGCGVRLAGAITECIKLVEKLGWPVLTTFGAADLIHHNHHLFAGRLGIYGARGANFTVQNADLLLSIGSRLNTTHVSSRPETFARQAKKIIVDIDKHEIRKGSVSADIEAPYDAKLFINVLLNELNKSNLASRSVSKWVKRCILWKEKYSPILSEYKKTKQFVNSYVFTDALSDEMKPGENIVHDMGTAYYCTMQALKVKKGQRIFSSHGLASMGCALPAAVGIWFAQAQKKQNRIIVISGDGGLQMSIAELQTIVHYKIPVKLFVFNNNSYLTIRHSQDTYFQGHYVDSTPESGYSAPDFVKIAKAYGFSAKTIDTQENLASRIREVLETTGPVLCNVLVSPDQLLIPKLSAVIRNGKYVQTPLENMYPFLSHEEILENMIIPPLEEY